MSRSDAKHYQPLYRRLTCVHGERWKRSNASLSRIWCRECEDIVAVEFYDGPHNPNSAGAAPLKNQPDHLRVKFTVEAHRDGLLQLPLAVEP